MLTKEECLKALEDMAFVEGFMNLEHVLKHDGAIALKYKAIYQLIEEHFDLLEKYKALQDENGRLTFNNIANNINDMNYKLWLENPPLKFEEMKAEDWVWDNEIRKYSKIFFVSEKYIVTERGYILYRANRFYRKQVTE